MKKLNILKITAFGFLLAMLAVSCIPESDVEEVGNKGNTLVKLFPAEFTVTPLSPVSTSQTALLFQVRRDVATGADLNGTTTVTMKFDFDEAFVDAYNQDLVDEWVAEGLTHTPPVVLDPVDYDGPVWEQLPSSLYTTSVTPDASGSFTLTFAAGEVSKPVFITVPDALQFDFSAKYMLAYQLISVSGVGVKTESISDILYCQVLAKNNFDGVYEVTAVTPMLDIVNAAFTGYYPFKYHLVTTGQFSCICIDNTVWFDAMHPMTNAGATSGYGAFGLELTFNEAGTITGVTNPWGNPPANTRMPALDPSGLNKWDPATKNIDIKYWMKQPSLVPTAPNIRVYFNEKWTFKGPR